MLKILLIIIFITIFSIVHEIAHALAALLYGEKDIEIHLGNGKKLFEWKILHIHSNIFIFYITYSNVLPRSEFKEMMITLAGPISNLLIAIVVFVISNFETTNVFLNQLVYSNLVIFVVSLFPKTHNNMDSDGMQILKSIKCLKNIRS